MSNMRHSCMSDLPGFRVTPFLSALSADMIARLSDAGFRRKFRDGQLVHSRGDTLRGISIIETGGAQVGIYGPDGTFILTSYLGHGHTFGEFTVFTELPRTHDVSAVGETTLLQISASRFLAICDEEPAYQRALLVTSLVRAHRLLEMLDALQRLPLLERTAKFLLLLSPENTTSPLLRFRQSDLASSLGVSRASLNRALGELSTLKLIEPGYSQLQIIDRETLQSWLLSRSSKPR